MQELWAAREEGRVLWGVLLRVVGVVVGRVMVGVGVERLRVVVIGVEMPKYGERSPKCPLV